MFKLLKLLKKLKERVSDYKTYFVCVITILGLIVAYAEGTIGITELYLGIMAATAFMTQRAAIAKSGK